MVELRDDLDIDLDDLLALRVRCGFSIVGLDVLAQQIAGARWVVHAHVDGRLIGFARAISDGVSHAYVASVMVDPDHQRRGIGRAIMERLLAGRDGIRFVLHTRPNAASLYAALGFEPDADIRTRKRR